MPTGARWLISMVLVGAVACGPGPIVEGSVIDGWPIGPAWSCAARPADCESLRAAAVDALDVRDPGHAPVVAIAIFSEGPARNERGELVPVVRSGGPMKVAVMRLADGSTRAIGVRIGIGDIPQAVHWGP